MYACRGYGQVAWRQPQKREFGGIVGCRRARENLSAGTVIGPSVVAARIMMKGLRMLRVRLPDHRRVAGQYLFRHSSVSPGTPTMRLM